MEKWTGNLIGRMHNAGITRVEIAEELGWTRQYICSILNGRRHPPKARERLEAAFQAVKERKEAQ